MKNISKYTIVLLAGSTLFTAVAKNGSESDWDKQLSKSGEIDHNIVVNRTDVGRQEVNQKGEALVRKANTAFQKGEFLAACKLYIEAKKEFSKINSAAFARSTAYCDKCIVKCYNEQALIDMAQAETLAGNKDYDGAIKLCSEAIKYCPERAEQLEARITFYEKSKAAYDVERSTSIEALNPDASKQEYQIQVLLEQGRKLVLRKEYAKAIRKFNDVLLIDPYNDDANQNLLACYNRVKDLGNSRRINTRQRMISEAAWKFSGPILPEAIDDSLRQNLLGEEGRKKVKNSVSKLEDKLRNIKIPALSLGEVTIAEAITTIRELSRTLDPDRQGINIVYLEPKSEDGSEPTAAGTTETQDVEGSENKKNTANNSEEEAQDDVLQPITLSNRSLLEALELVCKQAGLSSPQIEHDIVIISKKNVPSVALETRLFRTEIPDYEGPDALRKLFEQELNIPFPAGSDLNYHQNLGTLMVKNTRHNLDLLGQALEKYFSSSVSTPMVQIRLKVISVTQNDLNELAFNWHYGINTNLSAADSLTSKRTYMSGNNQLLRYYNEAQDGKANADYDKLLGFRWEKYDGSSVSAAMYALNQADSTDTLYAPQVTTLAGVAANVEMVTKRTFPEDWELNDEEFDNDPNNRIDKVDPFPNLEKEEILGMSFEITPYIMSGKDSSGRKLINILVDFEKRPIKTFEGWYVYDARVPPDPKGENKNNEEGEYYKMPIFDERKFKSNVTLFDGETALVAGIAIDTNDLVHDKIPILGDIPFIGRFFQSKYTKASKSNLLVFATCRLVKPDGTPLYPNSVVQHGEFDFGRNY